MGDRNLTIIIPKLTNVWELGILNDSQMFVRHDVVCTGSVGGFAKYSSRYLGGSSCELINLKLNRFTKPVMLENV